MKLLQLYLPVNEDAHEESVYHGHCRRLCRCKYAAVDTAQDNHRHQKAPKGVLKGRPALCSTGSLLRGLNVLSSGLDHNHHDQRHTHENTGHNAGHEHICNGHAGDGGIDHEGNAGRDDDGDGAGCGHQRRSKGRTEAALLNHGRNQYCTESCHRRRAGAGDGAEEAGHNDADNGQTASSMPHAGVDEANQPAGNAGLRHDVSGQHKKRNGQQQELADAGIHVCGHNGQTGAGIQDGTNRRKSQTDADGNAHEQEDKEGQKKNRTDHHLSSLPQLSR